MTVRRDGRVALHAVDFFIERVVLIEQAGKVVVTLAQFGNQVAVFM